MFKKILALILMLSSFAQAAGPTFDNLTQSDFDNVIRELSANSGFHSVTGAGALGSVFGFELALVGGMTKTPEIDRLSKAADSSASAAYIPHASLLAALTIPFGLTAEVLFFPSTKVGDVKYAQTGAALKWSMNSVLSLPINLAFRGYMTTNELSFGQVLNNASTGNIPVNVSVTETNSQTGLQVLLSPNLPIFEPYIGLGYIAAKGKLEVTGTSGSIFGFTASQSAESSPTSIQYLAGLDVKLLLLSLGVEYSRMFDTDSYNLKFGFKF